MNIINIISEPFPKPHQRNYISNDDRIDEILSGYDHISSATIEPIHGIVPVTPEGGPPEEGIMIPRKHYRHWYVVIHSGAVVKDDKIQSATDVADKHVLAVRDTQLARILSLMNLTSLGVQTIEEDKE